MRSILLKSLAWTVAVVGVTWALALTLVLSSLGICGPYGFRVELSQWVQFPMPQIALLFERNSEIPSWASWFAMACQFAFWFAAVFFWQRRKARQTLDSQATTNETIA